MKSLSTTIAIRGLAVFFLLGVPLVQASALQKANLGISSKGWPQYDLIMLAWEEKRLGQERGLESQWVGFSGGLMDHAMTRGAIDVGLSDGAGVITSILTRVPMLVVADLGYKTYFDVYVKGDGPVKKAQDLKGKKVALGRMSGTMLAYAKFLAKHLEMEKEIKFVGVGGGLETRLAALKAGAVDGFLSAYEALVKLIAAGEIRAVTSAEEIMPPKWLNAVAVAAKVAAEQKPEVVNRSLEGILEAARFVNQDRDWVARKLDTHWGFRGEAARIILSKLRYKTEGRIEQEAVENVVNFLVKYEVVRAEQPVDLASLYTNRFLPAKGK